MRSAQRPYRIQAVTGERGDRGCARRPGLCAAEQPGALLPPSACLLHQGAISAAPCGAAVPACFRSGLRVQMFQVNQLTGVRVSVRSAQRPYRIQAVTGERGDRGCARRRGQGAAQQPGVLLPPSTCLLHQGAISAAPCGAAVPACFRSGLQVHKCERGCGSAPESQRNDAERSAA